MKYIVFAVVMLQLYGCAGKEDKKVSTPIITHDSVVAQPDTFLDRNTVFNQRFSDSRFLLDTTEMHSDKYMGIATVLPKSTETEPVVYGQIQRFAKEKIKDFTSTLTEAMDKVDTIAGEQQGWAMLIAPICMYKTPAVISYCFETETWFTMMGADHEYNLFNYDRMKKRDIPFNDYFIMQTRADTAFMESIIARSVDWENKEGISDYFARISPVKFAFDDKNVYFFFDKYELYSGGQIGIVKKKYIMDHIQSAYR